MSLPVEYLGLGLLSIMSYSRKMEHWWSCESLRGSRMKSLRIPMKATVQSPNRNGTRTQSAIHQTRYETGIKLPRNSEASAHKTSYLALDMPIHTK